MADGRTRPPPIKKSLGFIFLPAPHPYSEASCAFPRQLLLSKACITPCSVPGKFGIAQMHQGMRCGREVLAHSLSPHPAVLAPQDHLVLAALAALEGGCFCNQSSCRGVSRSPQPATQLSEILCGAGALAVRQVVARSSHRRAAFEVPARENVDVVLKLGFQPPSSALPL